MMTSYKQSLVVILENGKAVYWTGYADDVNHAEGLAISYAVEKYGIQVWDTAFRPVSGNKVLTGESWDF